MKENKSPALKSTNAPELKVDDDLMSFLPRAERSDFEIPRIVLYQPTSKIEGAFSPGDLIDGTTSRKISGAGDKLQVVPVWFFKDFVVSEADTKKFRRNEPKTPNNAHRSIFEKRTAMDPDGVAVEWKERLNLFVIPFNNLDDDFPPLYRMIIKSSSMKEVKKLISEWDIQARSGLAPFSYVWSVNTKMLITPQSKYCVYQFNKHMNGERQAQVTAAQFERVKFWVKTIKGSLAQIQSQPEPEAHQSDEAMPF